jgi:hypothetical protein
MITWQDGTNGLIESLGGLMGWTNVFAIYRDKKVRGVNVWASAFFTIWGFWNLYYYPHLGQWASFVGGLCIVSSNVSWVYLAYTYRKN